MANKKKPPSGLTLTRSKNKFTAGWVMTVKKYKQGQNAKRIIMVNGTPDEYTFTKIEVPGTATSVSFDLDPNKYYPITEDSILESVEFRIRGKIKKGTNEKKVFTDWVTLTKPVLPPAEPEITHGQTSGYSTTFTIDLLKHVNENTGDSFYWGTHYEHRSVLRLNENEQKAEDIPEEAWSEITRQPITDPVTEQDATSIPIVITESAESIQQITEADNAVRWLQSRVLGPGGASKWFSDHITYSKPKPVTNTKATAMTNSRNGYDCAVSWTYTNTVNYPVDTIKIEYSFATPNADMSPSSPSWSEAVIGGDNTITPKYIPGVDTYDTNVSFEITDTPGSSDQILYIRVNTIHNSITTPGDYCICTDANGETPTFEEVLGKPSDLEVTQGVGNLISVTVTNNSSVEDTFLVIRYLYEDGSYEDIGIQETGGNTQSFTITTETPPDYTGRYGIGVYAAVGSYTGTVIGTDPTYTVYTITSTFKSNLEIYGGEIPLPPENITLDHLGDGNVRVQWDWKWTDADSAEIAWSDYAEALNSTDQPSSYIVSNSQGNSVIVRGLELGKTWYFWVRLIKVNTASIWSDRKYKSLSSAPNKPTLTVTNDYVTMADLVTANWAFVSTDQTEQQSAQIYECTVDGDSVTYDRLLAQIPNEEQTNPTTQYITLDPNELGWSSGNKYYLSVVTTSESGLTSEYSSPVSVTVVDPISCSITESSLLPSATDYDPNTSYSVGDYTIQRVTGPDDEEVSILYKCVADTTGEWDQDDWIQDENQLFQELRTLGTNGNEFVISPSAVGNIVTSTIVITRASNYFVDRPDGGTYGGYAGETILQMSHEGLGDFVITQDDLYGYLDDGAYYRLTLRVVDNYGQFASSSYIFRVSWTHQAVEPEATVEVDKDNMAVKIHLSDLENVEDGDVCDIYRISADKITMLYPNAIFGETYVDPYPTIGDQGGHRIVYRTYNGDYITSEGSPAWIDLQAEEGDYVESMSHLIDFDDDQLEVLLNVDMSNAWAKDFQSTKYLGGSTHGDWNVGVSRTGSMSTNIMTNDQDTMATIRALAMYEGICHVRTKDGLNYMADVQVNESIPFTSYNDPNGQTTKVGNYSLNITQIDSSMVDGLTLEEWEEMIEDEEE